MLAVTSHFDKSKPIAIIAEGFLRYLDFKQKALVANNVRSVLSLFGGAWITTDITLKSKSNHATAQSGVDKYAQSAAGIDVESNKFESVEAARDFFEQLGFVVEPHKLNEVTAHLVSPGKLNIPLDEIKKRIDQSSAFVMRVR
jgi:O-methyltransferase involved in polyketide biosynthesis